MPTFSYQGRDQDGNLVNGRLKAATSQVVADKLLMKGITPIDVTLLRADKTSITDQLSNRFMSSVKLDDMIVFCRQAQALLKAGVPIFEALMKIVQTTQSKRLKLTLEEVTKGIAQGQTLSTSLRRYPQVFSSIFCSIISAGESSGKLDLAFSQLGDYMSMEMETKKRIKGATRYPVFVVCFVIAAMLIMSFWVVPSFQSMYQNFDSQLPLPTQIIVAISQFITHYWPLVLLLLAVLFFALKRVLQTERGGYVWDRSKLRVPLMGSLLRRIVLARFARTLTLMIRSGVPIIDSLNLVAQASGNRYMLFYLSRACHDVRRGASITKAITDSQLFTPLVIQMLEIGEQSSKIDDMMEKVADFYEGEIDYDLSRLSDLIEPILLVFVAGLVLMLMLAVFLPMWDMVNFVKQ